MRGEEMHSLCRALGAGEEKFVRNLDSMYTGKVLACGEEFLLVEAFGHLAEWKTEVCEPVPGHVNRLGPPSRD